MALKLNERYPQRWDSPSNDYPQGAFKNLTELGEQDGSYLEQDWLNDYSGFFGALLRNAEMPPDGTIDTAQKSQFYDALIKVAKGAVADQGYATKTYVDNKFNEVPKTEIINDWDQASDENVFSAEFVSKRINQDADGNTIIKSGAQTFTFPSEGGEVVVDSNVPPRSLPPNLNTKYGEVSHSFKQPFNVTNSNNIIQSMHYDSKEAKFYALTVTSGGVNTKEEIQVSVFSAEKDTYQKLLFRTAITEVGAHQGIATDGKYMFLSKGSKGLSKGDGNTVVLTQIPTSEGEDLEVKKEFKVWDSAIDEVRAYLANSVTISSSGRYVLVSGLYDDIPNGGANKYFKIRVFKKSTFDGEGGDVRDEALFTFKTSTPVTSENYWALQGMACDDDHIYVMAVNLKTKFNELQVYNMKGDHVVSYQNEIGFDVTREQPTPAYEPQGLCWAETPSGLKLGCIVMGGFSGYWGNETRYSFLTVFDVKDNLKNIGGFNREGLFKIKSKEGSPYIGATQLSEGQFDLNIIGSPQNTQIKLRGIHENDSNNIYSNIITMEVGNEEKGKSVLFIMPNRLYFNNTHSDLGNNTFPLKDIYLQNNPIVTSDAKAKFDIVDIDEKYMRVMSRLKFRQFKLKAGTSGRTHFGIIAQEWIEACEAEGVDPKESGILVGDEKSGYAIRYNELQILFNAYILYKLNL